MSSSSANLFRLIPKFSRQNYVHMSAARILASRDLSLSSSVSAKPNMFNVTSVRGFSKVKDNTSAEVYIEEIFDSESEELSLRTYLYPDTTDTIIQEISEANTVDEVFDILDKVPQLRPQHLAQSLATFHTIQKISVNVPTDFHSQNMEIILEYNKNLLNHDKFPVLVENIQLANDNMTLEEASFSLLMLRKFGVPLSDDVQVKLYLKLKHNADKMDFTSISYLSNALRPRNTVDNETPSNAWKYGLLLIVPRIEELLDMCSTPEDLSKIAITLTNVNILVSDKLMTKFSEKFKSMVEAGMYTTTESIYHLKRLLALGLYKHDWHHSNPDYLSLLINIHLGKTHVLRPSGLFYLVAVIKTGVTVGLSYVEQLDILLSIKYMALPQKTVKEQLRKFIGTKNMTSNIREIIDIFISAHIYDHDMLDEFLSKCFESVKGDTREVCNLAQKYQIISKKSKSNGYRNRNLEKDIVEYLDKTLQSCYSPSDIANHMSILLSFDAKIKEEHLEKLFKNLGQFNSFAFVQIHIGLRTRLKNRSYKPVLNRKHQDGDYDMLNEIFVGVSRASQAYLMDPCQRINIIDVIRFIRHIFIVMGRVYHPKERLKYLPEDVSAALAHINSASSLAGNLRLVSPFVEFPQVVDILEQFYVDNLDQIKDASVRNLNVFAALCYFRNKPMNPKLVEIISQNLCREMDMLGGQVTLELCYNLAANQALPEFLSKEIFSSEFMNKLDNDIQNNTNSSYTWNVREMLMELNRCAVLQYPEYKVPWFHNSFCQQHIKTIASTKDHSLKKEVYNELCNAVGSWRYVRLDSYSKYFNPVHMELGLDADGRLVDLHNEHDQKNIVRRVAVQTYDEFNYFRDTKRLRGKQELNNLHLSLQGWQVLNINPFSWNSMFLADSDARVLYLQESVKAVSSN